jgi:hypothetical protein
MIKGIERVTQMLNFKPRGAERRLHGIRQDSPPEIVSVEDEPIQRFQGATLIGPVRPFPGDSWRYPWDMSGFMESVY